MTAQERKIKKLQNRQESIIESFTPEQQKLISEAINIEWVLCMVEEGHESELDVYTA